LFLVIQHLNLISPNYILLQSNSWKMFIYYRISWKISIEFDVIYL